MAQRCIPAYSPTAIPRSLLRARFDPWFVSQAEAEGVQCITGATVEALYRENGRVCGVICDNDTLRARYVVVAEGANSELAERHGLLPALHHHPWR